MVIKQSSININKFPHSFALMITNFMKYCRHLTYEKLLEFIIQGIQVRIENNPSELASFNPNKNHMYLHTLNTHTHTHHISLSLSLSQFSLRQWQVKQQSIPIETMAILSMVVTLAAFWTWESQFAATWQYLK